MQFQYEVFFEEQPDSLRLFSEFIAQFPADISGGYAETDDGPLLHVFQNKQEALKLIQAIPEHERELVTLEDKGVRMDLHVFEPVFVDDLWSAELFIMSLPEMQEELQKAVSDRYYNYLVIASYTDFESTYKKLAE